MSAWIDRLLGWLKWPIAALALFLLPGLLLSLYELLQDILRAPKPLYPFLFGAAIYSVLWFVFFRRPAFGAFFSTMEHELTHAIFAWITLHRVVGFRATWRSGGHIRYTGKGNWLIAIAPYFFPTLSLLVMLSLSFVPREYLYYGCVALGASVAYHAFSTWSETHRHQTDLREVGFLFCLAFLPSITVLMYGLLLSFASGGLASFEMYLHKAPARSFAFFQWARAFFS
jgi:hypothetical protein